MIVLAAQMIHGTNHRPEALEILARMEMPSSKIAAPGEFMVASGMKWSDLDVEVYSLLNKATKITELNKPVFVNISPETLSEPFRFALCARLLGKVVSSCSAEVVVEIPSESPIHGGWLDSAVTFFRSRGVRIALGNYGVGHATRERLDGAHWDYCKVDLSTLNIAHNLDWLMELGRTCAEKGTQIVFERLERLKDLDLVKAFPFAWIQGYGMSSPLMADDVMAVQAAL